VQSRRLCEDPKLPVRSAPRGSGSRGYRRANHDLLLRWPPDYPNFAHVIADEAHELSGVADEVYAQVVVHDEILERIDEIFGRPSDRDEDVLLPKELRGRVALDVLEWRREIELGLSSLGRSLSGRASEYGEVQLPAQPDRSFPEAAAFARRAAERIEEVAGRAESLALEMQEREVGENPVSRAASELRSAASGLRVAFAGSEEFVATFEGMGFGNNRWRLAIRPVSPAESFHVAFMEKLDSFAAVSASLFVGGDAFAALGEIEVEERSDRKLSRVSVESPFPYERNMRVVALKPVPDPTAETAEVIELLARELGGRTLGLFTSLKRMNEVAEQLDARLEGTGIEILSPRRALDDPASLVERFVNSPGGAVLLGARTFWQGIDLPGDDLQAVVIEKLPFEVPTELRKRREERIRRVGGDPFSRFALGKMLLHLKQMVGRLIRSEKDVGIAVIVDGRTDRAYFRRLREALPGGTPFRAVRRHQLKGVLAEVGLGQAPRE
jgi:ATP-dependent DNA helicase DinG